MGTEKGVCVSVFVDWPARVQTNDCRLNWPVKEPPCDQCNGFADDPACTKSGKICARRTKCDPWGQCGVLECKDDSDCIVGGHCVQGHCKKRK